MIRILFALALILTVAAPVAAECASGTVTVELSNDPGFENLYKYTVNLEWSLGTFALSHPTLFIDLENCECVCDPSVVVFDTPAGSSSSEEEGVSCDNGYYGDYVCSGDPSLPATMNGPAVKWDPDETVCTPGLSGTGTFCFYSPLPPGSEMTVTDAIAIKHGEEVCYGDVVGMLPICNCTVGNHDHSVSSLRGQYDEEDEDEE